MSKRLGLGRIWDRLVMRYPKLWLVEQAVGYAIWAVILLGLVAVAWKGYQGTL